MNKKPDHAAPAKPDGRASERQDRLHKLELLKQAGVNPYPAKARRDFTLADVKAGFDSLAAKNQELYVVGRVRSWREHGNISFAHIEDATGKLQLILGKNNLGAEAYKFFLKILDSGDFVQAKGKPLTTQAGEQSLQISELKLLTKTLRPMPAEHFGFKDEEERLRKRYLDILYNPEVKELISKKAKFWEAMRKFLSKNGFLEVETPVLENTTGGADARPFITHHHALDIDVYLRISAGELWQKRLMVAGLEKTFEIGRIFRNEGISAEHAQDYTQMEFYWAYANYEDGMKLVKKLYQYVAKETFGALRFKIGEWEVDLGGKWQKYDFVKTIKKYTGLDVLKASTEQIRQKLNELKIEYDESGFNLTRAVDNLWKYCRKNIAGPGFLVNVPVIMEPLAKRDEKNPSIVQRFQVILAGSEMGKGYSELNDPLDQAERFAAQQKLREAGDEEAQMFDHEFVEALEYGMPPTCGFGVSERLFSFLADKSIRDCQIFPLLRPKLNV
ncbi:lysine--tRNA ligase [Candidatus Falkowbacteria bacterium RIFCSPLOWO2_02_FULL_45_15]|uniref:Lysine--tRNA ligase n=2 Tax=Candidatus Falkowiibacteriota TaxID=1752728 RepID=A0A1F5RY22_9BACT|nr:MAG: lysine--tRNA ligase [Candidatus Falkowbacteria bacterium RIFCSPLOWO2_02_FULL_45_15]OGF19316.1 MAG: lysine--tRNA ligase [Candidatus Falkowbacteria bacterium RIFCSPHIGHO2_02_FULL_45_15]